MPTSSTSFSFYTSYRNVVSCTFNGNLITEKNHLLNTTYNNNTNKKNLKLTLLLIFWYVLIIFIILIIILISFRHFSSIIICLLFFFFYLLIIYSCMFIVHIYDVDDRIIYHSNNMILDFIFFFSSHFIFE